MMDFVFILILVYTITLIWLIFHQIFYKQRINDIQNLSFIDASEYNIENPRKIKSSYLDDILIYDASGKSIRDSIKY